MSPNFPSKNFQMPGTAVNISPILIERKRKEGKERKKEEKEKTKKEEEISIQRTVII